MIETMNAGSFTANDLRRVAEKADGLRGQPLGLVVDGDGFPDVIPVEEAHKSGRTVLLEIETPLVGDGMRGDAKMLVTLNGATYGGKGTDLETADAVFTSQAAVLKFVLPYYVRFKSGEELQELQDKLFKDKHVIAAVHLPTSVTHGLGDGKIAVMTVKPESTKPTIEVLGVGH
jgi:hypothetical protein